MINIFIELEQKLYRFYYACDKIVNVINARYLLYAVYFVSNQKYIFILICCDVLFWHLY